MKEKIICFALGLSEEDIEKGKSSFYGLNQEAQTLEFISITKAMLASKVVDILGRIITNSDLNDAEISHDLENTLSPAPYKYRVVIVLTMEREQVLQIMQSFKAILPDPQNIIFAVITDTAMNWTFGDYIGHLAEEHEYMKKCNAQK